MLTGLRRSEVVGLSWFEVNLDEGWMMIREAITAAEPEEELDEWDNAELERLGTKSEAGERYVGLSQDNIAVLKAWKRLQAMERLKAGEPGTTRGSSSPSPTADNCTLRHSRTHFCSSSSTRTSPGDLPRAQTWLSHSTVGSRDHPQGDQRGPGALPHRLHHGHLRPCHA